MKIKTSVSLSESTVRALDRLAGKGSNRSRVIEQAVTELVARRTRLAREARDLDILNDAADSLNREMAEFIELQAEL
jgi:metal-responsive CopG/Arc/MetJ family transcriptional regulator